MNNVTKEKISMAVIKACEDEKLMYKDAAKVFNTEPLYMTYLKNPKYWDTIPMKVWDKFHTWLYSGKKLKEYKMPETFEEAQKLADASMGNAINEELAALLNNFGASIVEPAEEPKIIAKPEAIVKRKKELKAKKLKLKFIPSTKKPKRKYIRKPKENPPEITQKILDDAPVPAHKYVAEAVPEGTPLMAIPGEIADKVVMDWLKICPERQMIDAASIQGIADTYNVPFGFVKEVIEREIANDEELIEHIMEQTKEVVVSPFPQPEEPELDLKSEIKTLAFLLQMEHEDNERLRAEVGYLNARIEYTKRGLISHLTEMYKFHVRGHWERLDKKTKEINELEDRIRAYQRRTFWDYLFNRPVR